MAISEVVVDTSSIIFGMQNRKNIFGILESELSGSRIYISKGVVKELKEISAEHTKRGRAALASLAVLREGRVGIKGDTKMPDEWMHSLPVENITFVTNDTDLWRRLKRQGKRVLKLSISGKLL